MNIYTVSYVDDYNKKHITFVKGYTSVRVYKERFYNVFFEPTNDPFVEDLKDDKEDFFRQEEKGENYEIFY